MPKRLPALPREIIVHKGHHALSSQTRICAPAEMAALIRESLSRAQLPLPAATRPGPGVINFRLDKKLNVGGQGYWLKISDSTVDARARTDDGLRRAAETLRLLMHAQTGTFGQFEGWHLPCVEVTDLGY